MPATDNKGKILDDISDVVTEIFATQKGQKPTVNVVYALNGTGKTRISRYIAENNEEESLCFNAIFQDFFTWDNENYILKIDKFSWIVGRINEQGLQNAIMESFRAFCNNDLIYPRFSSDSCEVKFEAINPRGDADRGDFFIFPIKISKAEETIFVWSVFYVLLQAAIDELQISDHSNRSTNSFDKLKYIIVDDPISSVDDASVIKISLAISELMSEFASINNEQPLQYLITTHHALFFNEIYNVLSRHSGIKAKPYILSRANNQKYILKDNSNKAFAYHTVLKEKIEDAINEGTIGKEHFNMFRILLEKTQLYFGYKNTEMCLPEYADKKEAIILTNKYSHFPEFEYAELSEREKDIFIGAYENYKEKYKPEE